MLKKIKSRDYLRFLLTYGMVLSLPLIVLFFLLYGHVTDTLHNEIISNNLNNVRLVRDEIDRQFIEFQSISFQMSLNGDLKPFYFLQDPLQGIQAKKALNNYKITNRSIYDILVYFRSDDYVFSPQTSMTLSRMINGAYRFPSWDYDTFTGDITSLLGWKVRPVETASMDSQSVNLLTYIFPLSRTHTATHVSVHGVVIIFVEDTFFYQLEVPYHDSALFIFDRDGVLLFSSDPSKAALAGEALSSGDKSRTLEYKDGGKTYIISSESSSVTGFTAVSVVPADAIMQNMNRLRVLISLSIVIIVALGSVFIYAFSNLNYSPIKKLIDYASKVDRPAGGAKSVSDVQNTLEYLSIKNQELNSQLKLENKAAAADVLNRLIGGFFSSEEQLSEECENAGLSIDGDMFTAAVVNIGKGINTRASISNAISENVTEGIQVYALTYAENVILLFSVKNAGRAAVGRWLDTLSKNAGGETDMTVTIGVGRFYRSPLDLSLAYQEASAAVEYRFLRGSGGVVNYTDTFTGSFLISEYPDKLIEKLKIAVRQKNHAQINEVLLNIISSIKENNPPIIIARSLCFEIIRIVSSSIEGLVIDGVFEMFTSPDFETIDELSGFVSALCEKMAAAGGREDKFVSDAAAYIEEHYRESSFSVEIVAEHFDMTVPGFSSAFKQKFGCTFIDYVTVKKIEYAKKLLSETDKTLTDISAEVGYSNVSSFIRRFKQITGQTPGQYHKKM